MKKKIEQWLIKIMLNDSSLSAKDIDIKKRTVNFGLCAMAQNFFEPKHHLAIYFLVKWFDYTCYQQTFVVHWCSDPDGVHIRWDEFNKEFKKHSDEKKSHKKVIEK